MQVSTAEGFGKVRLFEILDDLETKTRPIMVAARKALAEAKGAAALEPHNISYALAGDTEKVMPKATPTPCLTPCMDGLPLYAAFGPLP